MHPFDIQIIGNTLAIRWDDRAESFLSLEALRRHCPCAGCQGEKDIMGNLYKNPTKALGESAFTLRQLTKVGGYALRPIWGDGHSSGLFSYDYLRNLANEISEP